jgi:hypothetical protein
MSYKSLEPLVQTFSTRRKRASPLLVCVLALGAISIQGCLPTSQKSLSLQSLGKSSALQGSTSSLTVAWDPNPEPEVAGYRIYYGNSSLSYDSSIDAGMPDTSSGTAVFTVPHLAIGKTYYFAVVAYDATQAEGPHSNEISSLIQ